MRKIAIILIIGFVIAMASVVSAAVPHLINYQGKLTNSAGVPLDGTHNVTFRIYDSQAGGNLLWTEAHTQAAGAPVTITNGIFSIMLGSLTNLTLPFDQPYWLSIQVGGDSEMTPRQQITSVGYSIRSETAELANNATAVNNIQASVNPEPNKLLPLDTNAELQSSLIALIKDYGTSASTSTTKKFNALKICYGELNSIAGSQVITNLPFTSTATYQAFALYKYTYEVSGEAAITKNSGSQFTIYGNHSQGVMWIAIGT